MIGLIVKTPSEEFKRTMEEFLRRSGASFQDSVNARLLDVAIKAYQHTKIADRTKIESQLGVAAYEYGKYNRKTGAFKRYKRAKAVLSTEFSLAYMIIQKRFRERAGVMLPPAVAQADALKFIRSILKTVGFIRSGWIPAMRKLTAMVKGDKANAPTAGEPRGQPKGYVYPANSPDNPTGEIGNTTKVANLIGAEALDRAIKDSQAFMEAVMQKDQEKVLATMAGGSIG